MMYYFCVYSSIITKWNSLTFLIWISLSIFSCIPTICMCHLIAICYFWHLKCKRHLTTTIVHIYSSLYWRNFFTCNSTIIIKRNRYFFWIRCIKSCICWYCCFTACIHIFWCIRNSIIPCPMSKWISSWRCTYCCRCRYCSTCSSIIYCCRNFFRLIFIIIKRSC